MKFKKLTAGIVAAVMAFTAVATPLGDNLPAVRESTSLTAGAMSTSEVKNKIEAMARGDYGAEFKAGNYWNTKITSPCTRGTNYQHANQNYDKKYPLYLVDSNGKSIHSDSGAIQCKGFGYAVFDQLFGGGDKNAIVATKTTYTGTNKKQYIIDNAVVGDLLVLIESGSTYGHTGIYYGYDNNYLKMYDANGYSNGGTCKISITENRPWTDKKFYNNSTVIIMHAKCNGSTGGNIDNPATNVTDHYKLTSPDGYQTIRKEASTNSANLGSINAGNIVCVTKYSSDNKWGYLTYNGVSGWIRLYYVEKTGSSHSYGSWYTKTSPTCTSGGTEERKCSCGATESRSTSALGHNYGSTYFEADHPHKYAHLCQRCGYKEFTGGNLAIYEKCDICYNENLPSKPCLNISSNGFTESDTVSFTWDPTDKTTHYNLTVEVLSGDEYKTVCRQTYVNSGFQATFGKGQYRAVLDSYNSNMFHQYTSDWRDWVHNSSDYVYFDIECAHEFLEEVVSPTYDNEGYTLHTCTKCGYSFQDDFVPALSHKKVTGLRAKARYTNSLILAWDENEDAGGYEIEQYRDGDWQCIETIYDNTEVSYKVDDLRADTTYTFRIRPFVCIQDYNSYGEYTRLAAKTRIPNVTGLTSKSISSSTITLSWNKNNKATGYVIEQYKGGKWSGIATTKNNTTLSFTVKGLETDTTYTFRVKAYRTVNGKTEYSEYRRIQKTTAMDNVTGFKVKSTTSNSVTLTWNKTDRTTDYKIEQYKGGKWVDVDYISNEKSPVYTVTGLAPDTTYTFRIMALKITCMPEANNNSDYVRVAGKTRISNAAKFAGTALSNSAIKLVWSKNNMATGYVIEQYKGGKWTAIATTKNNTTLTFTVKGLAKGTAYSFRIKSFRKTGSTTEFSEYTAIKAATLK